MGIAEKIVAYVFASVVQLPFHLAIALPWLLLAGFVAFLSRNRVSAQTRFVLVSAISAVGLAPAYGFHLSMIPMYSLVLTGIAEPHAVATSFLATWVVILLVGFAITRVRNRMQLTRRSTRTRAIKPSAPVS
jgi:hypothetical protein